MVNSKTKFENTSLILTIFYPISALSAYNSTKKNATDPDSWQPEKKDQPFLPTWQNIS